MEAVQIQGGHKLQLDWSEGRKKLNASPVYQALKTSDGLLSKSFLENGHAMIRVTENVDELLLIHQTLLDAFKGNFSKIQTPLIQLFFTLQGTRRLGPTSATDSSVQAAITSVIGRRKLDEQSFLKISKRISRQLARSCVQLESLETTIKKDLKVAQSLTERLATHVCRCGNLREDPSAACVVCGRVKTGPPQLLLKIDPVLKEIIQNNVWLELAIGHIFEQKGFEVWIGPTVTGLSGTEHEVDIVARDKTSRILVLAETTSGRASLRELADLMLRGLDIPAHVRVLATCNAGNPNASKYAQRHGIAIVSDLRTNSARFEQCLDLIRKYQESLT